MILGGIGTHFHVSRALGDRLEIQWIFMSTLGRPQILRPSWLRVSGFIPGRTYKNSRIPETNSKALETETGSLETEFAVHRIHDTLELGLQRMPRTLVAFLMAD